MNIDIVRHPGSEYYYVEVRHPSMANSWIPIRDIPYIEATKWEDALWLIWKIGRKEILDEIHKVLEKTPI